MRRLHVSWHIAWFSVGVLAGAAVAAVAPPGIAAGAEWLLVIGALVAAALWRRTAFMLVVMVIGGTVLGLWRGSGLHMDLTAYAPYYEQKVVVSGRVAEDTTLGPRGDQRLRLDAIRINHAHLPGQLWVSTPSHADIKRGDEVSFRGMLKKGFGNLAGSMFQATLVEATRPTPGDVAREVRDWFANLVRSAVPEPQASLGIGYLVGQRSALPEDLNHSLQLLGLTHVVVASGYNLTILVRLARHVFARFSKYLAFLAATTMITAFILVTGMSPSMSRAGLVAGLSLAAWYYGRTIHPFVLLPVSAAITVIANPAYIWGDIGWYLSFAAFTGVMICAPLLRDYLWGKAQIGTFRRILVETSAAQVLTLPIIAYVFGHIAPLALPANMAILPFVPLAMLLTCIAGVGAWVAPSVAQWVGWPASWLLHYMTTVVGWLAELPLADSSIEFDIIALIASYGILAGICFWLWRKTKHRFTKDSIIE
jgi:competence protein ComEC